MVRKDIADTIAALGTGVGDSGIGIVRISGRKALEVADSIFLAKDGSKPSGFKSYTIHYGWIVEDKKFLPDRQAGKIKDQRLGRPEIFVDEVILSVMRAPRSYTKEDVVEINCHGGIVSLRKILALAIENGCRLAEPGEFTKRAFLNGRIDLAQAEAVLDIIHAKSDAALKISCGQLKGILSQEINKIRNELLEALTGLEANIDFPDDDIGGMDLGKFTQALLRTHRSLQAMLEDSKAGRIFREGVHAVICGKPNVGKSSLLNALLKEERSIVTAVAGTTRDTVEEIIDIKGIPVCIVDTAGILKPRGLVEKKAIARSKEQIMRADLVILVFDGSRRLSAEDGSLIRALKNRQVVAVINKSDLKQKIDKKKISDNFHCLVNLSAKKAKDLSALEDAISKAVFSGSVYSGQPGMVSNLRHINLLKEAEKLVAEAEKSLDNKLPLEFIAQDIKEALAYFDELLGKKFSEDLIDKIFSDFCIGK